MNEAIEKIKEIASKYTKEDYELIKDTVQKICDKGIGKSCFQDFDVVVDVVEVLTAFETLVLRKS